MLKKNTFVVYVVYPSSPKEYAYLCDIPGIRQGDLVLGNGNTHVRVVRTADFDPAATKWVKPLPNMAELRAAERKQQIRSQLDKLQKEQIQLDLWAKLAARNPEAKKLLAELKRLS